MPMDWVCSVILQFYINLSFMFPSWNELYLFLYAAPRYQEKNQKAKSKASWVKKMKKNTQTREVWSFCLIILAVLLYVYSFWFVHWFFAVLFCPFDSFFVFFCCRKLIIVPYPTWKVWWCYYRLLKHITVTIVFCFFWCVCNCYICVLQVLRSPPLWLNFLFQSHNLYYACFLMNSLCL